MRLPPTYPPCLLSPVYFARGPVCKFFRGRQLYDDDALLQPVSSTEAAAPSSIDRGADGTCHLERGGHHAHPAGPFLFLPLLRQLPHPPWSLGGHHAHPAGPVLFLPLLRQGAPPLLHGRRFASFSCTALREKCSDFEIRNGVSVYMLAENVKVFAYMLHGIISSRCLR
jgi:hypothetical protein